MNNNEMHPMEIPYHPSERKIDLSQGFDGSCYPPGQESVPRQVAIVRANRYAVDQSDNLIAFVWHAGSNARNILDYAQSAPHGKHKTITNLSTESSLCHS